MIDNLDLTLKDSFTSGLILGFPFSFPKENTSYNYNSHRLGYVALTSNPKISVAQKKKKIKMYSLLMLSICRRSPESALSHSECWLIDQQLFGITLAKGKGQCDKSPPGSSSFNLEDFAYILRTKVSLMIIPRRRESVIPRCPQEKPEILITGND